MTGFGTYLAGIEAALWSAGSVACLMAAAWLQRRKDRFGPARHGLIAALIFTALWSACGALFGIASGPTLISESLRNLAWIFAIYRLFSIDGRDAAMKPVRPMLAALAFAELINGVGLVSVSGAALHSTTPLHLLVSIGGLVLVHNLYGGAGQPARLALRWPASAIALLWTFELNHYAIAFLSGSTPEVTAALRGALGLPIAGLLVLGARERSEELRFRPSRAVTFQSLSLLLIGGYLVAMVAAAQWLTMGGNDSAALLQIAFVSAAAVAALALTTSERLRGWLRVTLLKHMFQHRYDYRAEWLRFTRTVGQGGHTGVSLHERSIQALADLTESPGGLLLTTGEAGHFELAARWQWPTAQVPAVALDAQHARNLASDGYVADLDLLRQTPDPARPLPQWLHEEPRAWAMVPLLHYDRLMGIAVLARPAYARPLDWEDFDLLRVVGSQLASYIAEQSGQAALEEASRFDEFNRRMAFVMHDIKNLASQMGLLARNAELHADNPAFRADMLVTLRNSTDKLNSLVARLSRYGAQVIEGLQPISAAAVARSVVGALKCTHPVTLVEAEEFDVSANRETLEQVLLHLVQNAIDASTEQQPVFISVSVEGLNGVIEVIDSGTGMSAEFVRSRLYKPFDSTKPGGFGIGAYEARALVRAMRGRLEVESREGMGTRFAVILPLAETAALIDTIAGSGNPGKKVA